MVRTVALALSILALLLVPTSGRAEDEVSPAVRFAQRAAALPAPAADAGFIYEGRVLVQGTPFGTYRFVAEPAELDGKPVWKMTDRMSFEMGEMKLLMESTALLAADLSVLEGREKQDESGDVKTAEYRRADAGLNLLRKKGGTEENLVVAVDGGRFPTVTAAALIHFCRAALPEAAVYETAVFEAWPSEGESPLMAGKIEVKGEGKWKDQPALLVTCARGDNSMSIAFAPDTRAFLGMRMTDGDGMEAELLAPGANETPAPAKDDFSLPAASAVDAALIATLAIATADTGPLDRICHWPSVHAGYTERNPDKPLTENQLREIWLAQIAKVEAQPREQAEMAMRMTRSQLVVTETGEESATVKFPEAFGSIEFRVAKVDGNWMIVGLPGL
jgi:hypothetical protein